MRIYILIAIIALVAAIPMRGFDAREVVNFTDYDCLKSSNLSFAIIHGYHGSGHVDTYASDILQQAKTAGFMTDVYFVPCRSKNGTGQVKEMFTAIPSSLFSMVWIHVDYNPYSNCSWTSHDAPSNCAYLTQIINAVKTNGKNPGIYTSLSVWQAIMGSRGGCPTVGNQKLWYYHHDGNPSFVDFSSFGGWTRPAIKQFLDTTAICGLTVNLNFYP